MFVAEEGRRFGVARVLVQAAIKFAESTRMYGLACGIQPTNSPSIALFESLGFSYAGPWDNGARLYSLRLEATEA